MEPTMLPAIDAAEASVAIAGSGAVLLDVREYDEWMSGHAPAATYLPMGEIAGRMAELPRDRRIVCVCRSGNRSARVTAWLIQQGFDAVNLTGGMHAWAAAGLGIVNHNGNAGLVL